MKKPLLNLGIVLMCVGACILGIGIYFAEFTSWNLYEKSNLTAFLFFRSLESIGGLIVIGGFAVSVIYLTKRAPEDISDQLRSETGQPFQVPPGTLYAQYNSIRPSPGSHQFCPKCGAPAEGKRDCENCGTTLN